MILVDTSVWIDHLRSGNETLASLLSSSQVLMHPFVVGEIACGNLLHNRQSILSLLAQLPRCTLALDPEVLAFIENSQLMGRGIGYVDAHLLAATKLTESARLWSLDRRLVTQARALNCGFSSN